MKLAATYPALGVQREQKLGRLPAMSLQVQRKQKATAIEWATPSTKVYVVSLPKLRAKHRRICLLPVST